MAISQEFKGRVARGAKGRVFVVLPFDPDSAWGAKARHYVVGTVNGTKIRALLAREQSAFALPLGEAWRRDSGIAVGDEVQVELVPEGPHEDNLPPDIAGALAAAPEASAFFSSLATFYRRNFIRWIESAKRPDTRARRIAEMMALLKEGKRER
jgi:hypothetical protein